MADLQQADLKVTVGTHLRVTVSTYVGLIYKNSQVKTKAKKRYLKAKKERRKQRKISTGSGGLPEEETTDNPEDAPPENTSTVIDLTQLAEQSRFIAEGSSKKRKKRKLDHPTPEGSGEDQQSQPVEADDPNPVDDSGSNCALPQFPLPTHPDPPSKNELALQGLDRAQIEAELVDPNCTFSIDLDTDNDQSVLSLKTRKRLIDLGVNELFAGISHYFSREVFLAAKVKQFRRPLFRSCFDPETNTPAFTIHITRRRTYVFRLLLAAGRRSHMYYQ